MHANTLKYEAKTLLYLWYKGSFEANNGLLVIAHEYALGLLAIRTTKNTIGASVWFSLCFYKQHSVRPQGLVQATSMLDIILGVYASSNLLDACTHKE